MHGQGQTSKGAAVRLLDASGALLLHAVARQPCLANLALLAQG
jgi:hypothetical protein